MKMKEPVYSAEVEELLKQREMEIQCWKCGCKAQLTLHWLGTHRDMYCRDCGTIIILNTSRLQSEVTHLRRQLGTLHAQMCGFMGDARLMSRCPPRPAESKPQFKLALARLHPDKLSGAASRRHR